MNSFRKFLKDLDTPKLYQGFGFLGEYRRTSCPDSKKLARAMVEYALENFQRERVLELLSTSHGRHLVNLCSFGEPLKLFKEFDARYCSYFKTRLRKKNLIHRIDKVRTHSEIFIEQLNKQN